MHNTYTTATNQISTKDLRNQLASVVDRVALRGESFVVTKFGTPRAVLMPLGDETQHSSKHLQKVLRDSHGIWKDRPESTSALAQKLRRQAERRQSDL